MTQTYKPTDWRVGTVTQIIPEAPGVRSYCFSFDSPIMHYAGQHYEIRLTAEDGYQAARLYSAAMPANGTSNMLQLTIALMADGEVSSYIFSAVTIGSQLEIRGPLGGYFVWEPQNTSPILLVGGGTGIVPLRAIRLQHQQADASTQLTLLYSVKTYPYMPYKYELFPRVGDPPSDVVITFTEETPQGWSGYKRRIDAAMIRDVLQAYKADPEIYVCGSTPMVESVTRKFVEAGIDPSKIKAERFGATAD